MGNFVAPDFGLQIQRKHTANGLALVSSAASDNIEFSVMNEDFMTVPKKFSMMTFIKGSQLFLVTSEKGKFRGVPQNWQFRRSQAPMLGYAGLIYGHP